MVHPKRNYRNKARQVFKIVGQGAEPLSILLYKHINPSEIISFVHFTMLRLNRELVDSGLSDMVGLIHHFEVTTFSVSSDTKWPHGGKCHDVESLTMTALRIAENCITA